MIKSVLLLSVSLSITLLVHCHLFFSTTNHSCEIISFSLIPHYIHNTFLSHFFSSLFTTILLSKCFQQQYHQKKYTFFNIQHFIPISQFLSPSSYPLIFSLNHPHSMKEALSQPTSHHISIIYPTKFSLSRSSIAQLVRAFGC